MRAVLAIVLSLAAGSAWAQTVAMPTDEHILRYLTPADQASYLALPERDRTEFKRVVHEGQKLRATMSAEEWNAEEIRGRAEGQRAAEHMTIGTLPLDWWITEPKPVVTERHVMYAPGQPMPPRPRATSPQTPQVSQEAGRY